MGLVSIFDKTVHGRASSPLSLLLLMGITQTVIGLVILGTVDIPTSVALKPLAAAILSGLTFGLSNVMSQKILFQLEASRTIPITQSAPIFAAILAAATLNESISSIQWLGIFVTVTGCLLLSLRINRHTEGRNILLEKSFYTLIISSMLLGSSNVIGKTALNVFPVIFTHGIRSSIIGLVFLAAGYRPLPRSEISRFVYKRDPILIVVVVNDFIIANLGLILLLLALSLGPSSLVTALAGTRALFVVIYGAIIAYSRQGALGEEATLKTISIKLISTLLIIGGAAAIVV